MLLPKEAVRACDGLYARNKSLAHSSDDNDRRRLTRMIVEQIAFALGDRWGCKKRAGLGDEWQSKDAIAYREDDGTVSVWDWQNGTTRQRAIKDGAPPNHPHLSTGEATFMPVTPTKHLDSPSPLALHKYQGGADADGLCGVCQKRRDDPIHERSDQSDFEKPNLVDLSIVMEKLQVIGARIDDVGARILRVEAMFSNLRSAVQVTDDRVERTYQDLVNRLNAIANIRS